MDIKQIIMSAGGVVRVAAACGVSHSTVSEWTRVPVRHLRTVAELSGLPVERLLPEGGDANA